MRLERLHIDQIDEAFYNPRKDLRPGDKEYEKLRKSIAEFDMVLPLVWNERSGRLVGGHQRLKVLKEMGVEEVEVSVVCLDEQMERALNIALNKVSGEWDIPMLKEIIEELDTGELDLEVTGFDQKELENLMTWFYTPEDEQEIDEGATGGAKMVTCEECGCVFSA